MEPEKPHVANLPGIGTKNPTIHVLDSLMGMGKSTALINMIKADTIATAKEREGGPMLPEQRWLPTGERWEQPRRPPPVP